MKHTMAKKIATLTFLLAVLAIGNGCSNNNAIKNAGDANLAPYVPDNTRDDGFTAGTGGATTALTISDMNVFENYVGRAVDSISNAKININVQNIDPKANDAFAGSIQIYYTENSVDVNGNPTGSAQHGGTFTSGNSINDAQYNKWYNQTGGTAFKSFFQDSLGGIIVLIDKETNDLGTWSGSVYFKNFNFNICSSHWPYYCAPQPPNGDGSLHRCWFISGGSPYDCRDFLSGNAVRPDLIQAPAIYQKLGTFSSLDIKAALNGK